MVCHDTLWRNESPCSMAHGFDLCYGIFGTTQTFMDAGSEQELAWDLLYLYSTTITHQLLLSSVPI